jgi:hypothetical protein
VNTASVDNAPWVVGGTEPPRTLEIVQVKQGVVLSWSQFVYAEGSDDEIRIAFASHDVVIRGAGLDPLLHAIASQRVALIRESTRSEHFSRDSGRFIREIAIRKIEGAS